jgi:hypothetical protein
MFRIGIILAASTLSLSIAGPIGDASAQGNQRKAAPAATRLAPAARPVQVARPRQVVPSARVRPAPAVRLAPAPPRPATVTRRAPQIVAPARRVSPRIATPPARATPAIRRATPGPNRIVGSPAGGRRGFVIRDASRATIAGRNFSIWRNSHRVRHGGRWRTLVGLSTLSIITLGSAVYYPYAYIDAPAPYCQGLTEDGCRLQWQEVPTLEGPRVYECVAYCPRQ